MAPQLSYSINMQPVAYPGQPVDISHAKDALTALAVAGPLPYGVLAVVDSANSGGFDKIAGKVPSAASDITSGLALGVVLADQGRAQDPSVSSPQMPQFSAASVLRKGRVWVIVEENVNDGDLAFVRFAAGAGGTQAGSFRKSDDTTTAAQLSGAVFRGAALAGGYAVVELNLI
jgi:hypothetical protein